MGTKKIKDWQYKNQPKKMYDPSLLAAVQMANFQMKVKEDAIRTLTVDREVEKTLRQFEIEAEDQYTDWIYGAVALALHRKFSFGARRIVKLFDEAQAISQELGASGMNHNEIWDIVREEIGLDITTS